MFFCLLLFVQRGEAFADGFMGVGDEHEAGGVLVFHDALQGGDLLTGDHAQHHGLFLHGVRAPGLQLGDAPAHVLEHAGGDLVPLGGNDKARLVAGKAHHHQVYHASGHVDVDYGVQRLLGAHGEARGHHHHEVEGEQERAHGYGGEAAVHHAGEHVGASRGGAAPQYQPQAYAQRHAAEQGAKQQVVRHGLKGQYVYQHAEQRSGQQAPEGEDPAYISVARYEQRHVERQRHHAYRQPEQVIEYNAYAREPAGGDVVGGHEQGIRRAADQAAQEYLAVREYQVLAFESFHFLISVK